jgi:hypothetical protein
LHPSLGDRLSALATGREGLQEVYLALKEEMWTFSPRGQIPFPEKPELPLGVADHIRSLNGQRYRLDETQDDFYLFFVNRLQALLILAEQGLRRQFVDRINPEPGSRDLRSFLQQSFAQGTFPGLAKRDLSPQRAREILHELSQQPWAHTVTSVQQRGVIDAANREHRPRRYCCRNTPGCTFCPNNRGFLNPEGSPRL